MIKNSKSFLGGVFSVIKETFEKCNGHIIILKIIMMSSSYIWWIKQNIDKPQIHNLMLLEHTEIKEKTDDLWEKDMLMKKELMFKKTKV